MERYDSMAIGYEVEQSDLKQELAVITKKIEEIDMRETCIREFVEQAKSYVEMKAITPEVLRVFVRKIEAFEKKEKYFRLCTDTISPLRIAEKRRTFFTFGQWSKLSL